jgi:hypothetical protein
MAIRGRDARVRFNGTNLGNVKTYKLDIKQETFNVTTLGVLGIRNKQEESLGQDS